MISVLVVEDDLRLADALLGALRGDGYDVRHAATAEAALAAEPADLVLLDLGLPDRDGIEVCRQMRARYDLAEAGIIIVTARGQERERVLGLRSGADDYVVKPLSLEELRARIEAVLRRRAPGVAPTTLSAGGIQVDLATREVSHAGESVALTRKEFDLLVALLREPGTVLTHDRLMLQVWQTTWSGTRRTLEVHVGTLRAKLNDPGIIETVRGVGYRLTAPSGPDNSSSPEGRNDAGPGRVDQREDQPEDRRGEGSR